MKFDREKHKKNIELCLKDVKYCKEFVEQFDSYQDFDSFHRIMCIDNISKIDELVKLFLSELKPYLWQIYLLDERRKKEQLIKTRPDLFDTSGVTEQELSNKNKGKMISEELKKDHQLEKKFIELMKIGSEENIKKMKEEIESKGVKYSNEILNRHTIHIKGKEYSSSGGVNLLLDNITIENKDGSRFQMNQQSYLSLEKQAKFSRLYAALVPESINKTKKQTNSDNSDSDLDFSLFE